MDLKSKTGFIASSILFSLSLAMAAIKSRQGDAAEVFLFTLLSWTGYMSAHKLATGRFVDGKDPGKSEDRKGERMAPEGLREKAGFLLGATVFVTGMFAGGKGIGTGEVFLTFTGGILFTSGYIIAHWSSTEELL